MAKWYLKLNAEEKAFFLMAALALIVFAGIREQLSLVNIPKGMRGMSIALVTAGLLAMAFMGFSGVDKGLAVLFGL